MSPDSFILCIETSTSICSVSLCRDRIVLGTYESSEPNVHASKVTVFIEKLLRENSIRPADLSAVAVSKGPGSYTGLRIGVSVAKGLCYALDIPLLSVNSLEALYNGFLKTNNLVLNKKLLYAPMIDARRMEVYTAFFAGVERIKGTHALILDEHSFEGYIAQGYHVVLFGDGADKLDDLYAKNHDIQVIKGYRASSTSLCEPIFAQFDGGVFEDVAYFEPYYLKDFVPTTAKKKL